MVETDKATSRAQSAKLVLIAMTVANAMILVDQTAVPLTLPSVMREFHVGSQYVQWMLNASLLPLAALLVFGGRLGDLLGRRRIFLIGACMFAGASAVGGAAPVFTVVLVARVVQGVGGALMLPATVAIVSGAYPPSQRGRALGAMGGSAAIAGALGPTIGGLLTSAISWRAVLLVNVPLAIVCVVLTLRSVPADPPVTGERHIDVTGTVFLSIALTGLVFGFSQTQSWGWDSPGVVGPLLVSVVAAALFVWRERRAQNPLMSFTLLRSRRNYLGATLSQGLAGMLELGLALLFPLLLVLNLEMSPVVAGLALIPTTVPMVLLAPLAGRWYDRAGGRPPLVTGFAVLAAAGLVLAWGVGERDYLAVLPGLLLYGIGLALVLTTNDPVTVDTVPDAEQGQASGVSATAEQGGGAIGIALLFALFHQTYLNRLEHLVDVDRRLKDLTTKTGAALRNALQAAEQTGLRPKHFDPGLYQYLFPARAASERGYAMAFLAASVIAVIGLVAVAWLVRKPDAPASEPDPSEPQPTDPPATGGLIGG